LTYLSLSSYTYISLLSLIVFHLLSSLIIFYLLSSLITFLYSIIRFIPIGFYSPLWAIILNSHFCSHLRTPFIVLAAYLASQFIIV
jgi:hypothetical protein